LEESGESPTILANYDKLKEDGYIVADVSKMHFYTEMLAIANKIKDDEERDVADDWDPINDLYLQKGI
jgi:hypothetical protein